LEEVPEIEIENKQPADEATGQAPSGDQQGNENTPVEQAGSEAKTTEPEESTLSHDDAISALKKTRVEAASYRTKVRELEQKFEGAKTPEEIEALVAEMRSEREVSERTLVVENVALKHKLPDDLTQILTASSTGKTREELEAHALILAKYAPTEEEPEPDLSGGLRPGGSDSSFDPVETSRRARARR
jgi:DNA-directed RNA polymerase subunit F